MPPDVAVIVVTPSATASALPPASTTAMAGEDELQVADAVRSCSVLSVSMPIALNWRLIPAGTLVLPGVTAIDFRVAGVTSRVVVPEIDSRVAVTVVSPAATAVAIPSWVMVATPGAEELQATWAVISCCELSEKCPGL